MATRTKPYKILLRYEERGMEGDDSLKLRKKEVGKDSNYFPILHPTYHWCYK